MVPAPTSTANLPTAINGSTVDYAVHAVHRRTAPIWIVHEVLGWPARATAAIAAWGDRNAVSIAGAGAVAVAVQTFGLVFLTITA